MWLHNLEFHVQTGIFNNIMAHNNGNILLFFWILYSENIDILEISVKIIRFITYDSQVMIHCLWLLEHGIFFNFCSSFLLFAFLFSNFCISFTILSSLFFAISCNIYRHFSIFFFQFSSNSSAFSQWLFTTNIHML